MKPNTISIIERIREFRNETNIPVCFTLDAGPNVHMLYPDSYKDQVMSFIDSSLMELTVDKVIHDNVGSGPEKLQL